MGQIICTFKQVIISHTYTVILGGRSRKGRTKMGTAECIGGRKKVSRKWDPSNRGKLEVTFCNICKVVRVKELGWGGQKGNNPANKPSALPGPVF